MAISGFKSFLGEVVLELKRCIWPTWSELKSQTIMVIVVLFLLGFFVGVFTDQPLKALVSWLVTGRS